jgi:hypothetical protein
MNEPEGKSLKDLYKLLKNKQLAWLYMRYFTFYYDSINKSCHEIIEPRSGSEYFTYKSDKYWAKIIYGLLQLQENHATSEIKLCEAIHNGSRINLIKYWYPILYEKKYIDKVRLDIKYYLYSYELVMNPDISNIESEKEKFSSLYSEDAKIARIIYNMNKNTNNTINRDFCLTLLKYINRNNHLILIDKFYTYLTRPIGSCSIETENKEEMIHTLEYYA